ncbi:MAG: sulfotransferase [Candidatus Nitrosocaldus sp.]|nr:sulfotransferase [Candidatus Nitrosocaldus sp.]MDW8276117.1 sulfotransferase [Candidatus Nitrosocaldus sp.]
MNDLKPNLFIPGFSKAGTTVLVDYLAQHKDIFVPWRKEPHTLTELETLPSWFNTRYKMGKLNTSSYLKLYRNSKDYRYRVDGSTSYTFNTDTAKRIKEFNPDAKIIMCIREQKSRLISSYLFTYLSHREDNLQLWIEKYFVPALDTFLIYNKVKAYYDVFGDNLRVVDNSDLKNNPQSTLNSIFKFLDVESIDIVPIYRNPSMVTPFDNKLYRYTMFILYLIIVESLNISRDLGIESIGRRTFNSIRYKFAKRFIEKKVKTKKDNIFVKMIPAEIARVLEDDYTATLDFVRSNNIILN